MIAFIKGKPVGAGADYIVIDVGGVGYKIYVPTPVIGILADKDEVTVYTYLHVREDAMLLYGFLEERDREVFELLIQISGIGPKVALGILSSIPVPSLVQAVLHEQVHALTTAPGVGKKTAQRVIIELRDKMGKIDTTAGIRENAAISGGLPDETSDAVQALGALGYNPADARKALNRIVSDQGTGLKTEELVKLALKELGRF